MGLWPTLQSQCSHSVWAIVTVFLFCLGYRPLSDIFDKWPDILKIFRTILYWNVWEIIIINTSESCTANLAVHYYPLFLIERHNIWQSIQRGLKDELLSSSKISLNKKSEHFNYHFWASFKKKLFSKPAKVAQSPYKYPDDKHEVGGKSSAHLHWLQNPPPLINK